MYHFNGRQFRLRSWNVSGVLNAAQCRAGLRYRPRNRYEACTRLLWARELLRIARSRCCAYSRSPASPRHRPPTSWPCHRLDACTGDLFGVLPRPRSRCVVRAGRARVPRGEFVRNAGNLGRATLSARVYAGHHDRPSRGGGQGNARGRQFARRTHTRSGSHGDAGGGHSSTVHGRAGPRLSRPRCAHPAGEDALTRAGSGALAHALAVGARAHRVHALGYSELLAADGAQPRRNRVTLALRQHPLGLTNLL